MVRNLKNARNSDRATGGSEAESIGDGSVAVLEESPYKYYVEGEKVRSDGAFFELLLAKVLQERGALPNFSEVWPRGAQALAGLNPLRLSQHSVGELESIIGTVGGEFATRLRNRTGDVIVWADAFWRIKQIYGSFRQYVRSFDVDGHDSLVADLSQRLVGLSPNLILTFLRAAGEKIPNMPQFERPAPGPRQGKPRSQSAGRTRSGGQVGSKRRRGRGGGNQGKPSTDPTSGTSRKGQQKPAEQNKDKSTAKSRKGRRTFFRRKRAARTKTSKD